MTYSITEIQEDVLTRLSALIAPLKVIEQGIVDVDSVERTEEGEIFPYLAVQFGDLQQGIRHAMSGPQDDDYYLPIYMQFIGPDPKTARNGANKINQFFLGTTFTPWGGSARKKAGGNMFPIVTTDNATEAYQFPSSWALLVQSATIN